MTEGAAEDADESAGGLVSPLLGRPADATSLQTALTPLIAVPALNWLLFHALPEPAAPGRERLRPSAGKENRSPEPARLHGKG